MQTDLDAVDAAPSRRGRRRAVAIGAVLLLAGAATGVGVAGAVGAFTDVPAGHPFEKEIGWMAETGISEGYADGTYRPGEPVSRQAMSAFMARLSELTSRQSSFDQVASASTNLSQFTDVASVVVNAPAGMSSQIRVDLSGEGTCVEGDGSLDPAACEVRVTVDSTVDAPWVRPLTYASHGDPELVSAVWLVPTVAPGDHTVTVQFRENGADGEADTTATLTDVLVVAEVISEPSLG